MAFIKSTKENLEEKAASDNRIAVDKPTAMHMQWTLIYEWEPLKDVFYLKYGPMALGAITAASAYSLCTFYRRKLNLKHYAHFSTYIPSVIFPGALAIIFHKTFVSSNIILKPECIVCSQTKAVALQGIVGVVHPLLMAPFSSYMVANLYNTARIPSFISNWREVFKFHMKLSRSYYSQTVPIIIAVNILVPIILTYLEYKNMFTLSEKVRKIEEIAERMKSEEKLKK